MAIQTAEGTDRRMTQRITNITFRFSCRCYNVLAAVLSRSMDHRYGMRCQMQIHYLHSETTRMIIPDESTASARGPALVIRKLVKPKCDVQSYHYPCIHTKMKVDLWCMYWADLINNNWCLWNSAVLYIIICTTVYIFLLILLKLII